ncbi:hypothetical protein LC087_17045 [Bacillus carboniphilus]|uniref:Uncharacterized protein n=1 Tax=Bacillus carboniphilus TaxID=86663 RepID=A0ABY9JV61_9BACI|nr:hypothetical protein [Bacillus carboniphilus]WLR42388.1 hypothetical protein LC087_17045 [Bacillus carboniphilus]
MSRRAVGTIMVLVGIVTMAINIWWFKSGEYYDWFRRASGIMCTIGMFLIPDYVKDKKECSN